MATRQTKKLKLPEGQIRLIEHKDANETENGAVAAVVVSVVSGTSYDALFRKIPQDSDMGKIVTYGVKAGKILERIMRTLQGEILTEKDCNSKNEAKLLQELKTNCDKAGRDAVCFNFECCSHYSAKRFGSLKVIQRMHVELTGYLLNEYGCMCMFSDFSLKALIAQWDSDLLGPNPFVDVGSINESFDLVFNPEILKKSPSAQLETVGKLCDNGHGQGRSTVGASRGTIAFTLTNAAADLAEKYEEDLPLDIMRKKKIEVNNKVEIPEAFAVTKKKKGVFRRLFTMCGMCGTSNVPDAIEATHPENEIDAKPTDFSPAQEVPNSDVQCPYTVQVLTVAEKMEDSGTTTKLLNLINENEDASLSNAAGVSGLAGHVILSYPPIPNPPPPQEDDEDDEDDEPIRGRLLVSCGHWLELMKIDANIDRLLVTAQQEWGVKSPQYQEVRKCMETSTGADLKDKMQGYSHKLVQSRAPAGYNRRLKKMKARGEYVS